jgi:transcriptional regulator GlxA family with amidase domain
MHGSQGQRTIAIAVLDGMLALDVAVAVQAFGPRPTAFLAMRDDLGAPYDLFLCGGEATRLRAVGLAFDGVKPWSELSAADTVVVPGLDEPDRRRDPEALEALAAAGARGARMVALCTGVFVLGFAGLLAGKRVTTHWALADRFRALFPEAELLDDELFVDDGDVLSSGGMLAAADLCLHVLRQDLGQSYANDVSRLLVTPPFRTGGQAQYRAERVPSSNSFLAPLMHWALEHLDEDLALSVLAAKAHVSTRTLSRHFEAETGRGALQWVAERRVERARTLLEDTTMSVTDVAYATGFGSLGSFRRQFARVTGTTPTDYRATFRAPS